jgi:hypothetical protein
MTSLDLVGMTLPEIEAEYDRLMEIDRAEASWKSPGRLAAWLTKDQEMQARHLDLIDEAFIEIAEGRERYLMLTMPPRHGKSRRAARWGPLWYLRKFPTRRVFVISYGSDLADEHGRWVRDTIKANSGQNGGYDLGMRLNPSSEAADRWDLLGANPTDEGGMRTAGVGGAITGRGAHLIVVDDPVKNEAAAASPAQQKALWTAWTKDILSRREPGAAVIVIQCMTGETPVLMADGTERPLRDVRPGDLVATYAHGSVATSKVRHWANQGRDSIFAIRMRSGAVVRANARHPFLVVDEGMETWRRTSQLRPGSVIRAVRGVASPALPAAGVRPSARACATRATTRPAGQPGIALPPSTRERSEPATSSIATASPSRSTSACWRSRTESAPSAGGRRMPPARRGIGATSSASITITELAESADCCATTATSSLPALIQWPSSSPPSPTYETVLDEVVSITPCGVDYVYDVQIDRTENFIAAGLVSHNTRWNEKDLAGQILQTALTTSIEELDLT